MEKYKLTKTKKEYCGITLYQIEALKDFSDVKKGDRGGFIEKEDNLSQEDNCWVSDNAWVFGDVWVFGNAWVFGDVWVYGNARVSGNAQVYGNAWVYGNARVSGNARVYGNAWVYGNARVSGDAQVYGDAQVSGDAQVYGELKLIGGYFYHYKEKSEEIERVEVNEDYELLCRKPKLAEEDDDLVEIKISRSTLEELKKQGIKVENK